MARFKISDKDKGYFIPNTLALLVLATTRIFGSDRNGTLIFAEFIILPLFIGIFGAWFWRYQDYSTKQAMGRSCISCAIAIGLSAICLGEGVVCLIIVSPLIMVFVAIGVFMGRGMFNNNNPKLNISIVSLLALVFIADVQTNHHYENMVSDVITVNAPVEKVWPLVVAYKRIEKPDGYFLSLLGMPTPVQSTVTGYNLGAGRKCIFSNGYVFNEKITAFDINRNLTFSITNQPKDPEIMGHIDIQKGQFILKDNGNGTTTLIGNSWYQLHVFPIWYFDRWAESITRNVHLRVMDHIKTLAEQH